MTVYSVLLMSKDEKKNELTIVRWAEKQKYNQTEQSPAVCFVWACFPFRVWWALLCPKQPQPPRAAAIISSSSGLSATA